MADVYPIFNGPNVQFVPGIPAVPHLGITDKEAKALIATGAFTDKNPDGEPPPKRKASRKPPTVAATTEAPADAGALDSPAE